MAKDSYGKLVPRQALVQRAVEIYRYYLNSSGHVKMDKEDLKGEIREIKHAYGWDLDARIQIMRSHAAVALKKMWRFRACRCTNPKPEEANVHLRVSGESQTLHNQAL